MVFQDVGKEEEQRRKVYYMSRSNCESNRYASGIGGRREEVTVEDHLEGMVGDSHETQGEAISAIANRFLIYPSIQYHAPGRKRGTTTGPVDLFRWQAQLSKSREEGGWC